MTFTFTEDQIYLKMRSNPNATTATDIAAHTGHHISTVYRVLRTLVSLGLVTWDYDIWKGHRRKLYKRVRPQPDPSVN